jgi:hypothetical protein
MAEKIAQTGFGRQVTFLHGEDNRHNEKDCGLMLTALPPPLPKPGETPLRYSISKISYPFEILPYYQFII